MKINLRLSLQAAVAASLVSLFAGCASGPELEKYPRREIDRPYTLPEGVATWHIPIVTGVVQDSDESVFVPPIAVPLIWESALSDDWNLIFYPLPLGVSHQFANTESARTGFTLLNSFSYSSLRGFRLIPNIAFGYRAKLDRDTALDVTPSVTLDIPFEKGESFRWSAALGVGPLFQLSETFSLKPSVSVGVTRGWTYELSSNLDDLEVRDTTTFTLGAGLASVWSFARQWDLRPAYVYSGSTSSDGLRAHC
jgi:hypothetical protein